MTEDFGPPSLASILDSLPFSIVVVNNSGMITYANTAWRKSGMENGNRSESATGVGANYLEVCRRAADAASEGALEALNGIKAVLAGDTNEFSLEYAFHSAGKKRWLLMNVTPLTQGKEGVVISHAEITDRKLAEESLRESKERFRAFVETTNEWIWAIDTGGIIAYSNPAVKTILGYEVSDMLGRNILDFIDDEVRPEALRILHEAIEKRQGWSGIETKWHRRDGTICYLECNAVPAFDAEGNLVGFRGADRDVTERKFLEEELIKSKKLESVGILAGGIAHDFNNLLSAILGNIGYAEMLTDKQSKVHDLLKDAEKACLHTAQLTKELITFSKGGEPVMKSASIGELVQETAQMTCDLTDSSCDFRIAEDLWPVAIDDGQLRQVVHNIMKNATEAATGKSPIEIAAENVVITGKEAIPLGKGDYVRISIRDHGTGIPKEDLPRVFDPYFTTKEASGRTGMGLGLSVCHSIIRKHEGFISIDSEEGKGTTVYFYLPACEKEAS